MKVDKSKWEVKKLGEVCDIINGLWKGKKAPFIKVGVIRNTNFTKDCQLDLRDVAYLDVEQKQFQKRKLKKNDIIIEKSGGGPKQPVGRAVLFKEDYGDYSFSNFTSTLRIINSMVLQACYLHKFLYYFYVKGGTVDMQNHLTGIHNLDFKQYKMISIPVPSLPEQQAIASELDAIQSLITKYKEQLNDYDNLAKSIFNEMFGDVVSNEKKWRNQLFGNLFMLKSGDGLSSKQQLGGEYPVYGGNGVNGQHCKYNKDGEYIIIGRVGAYCGNVRLVKGRFWLTDNGFELVVKKNNQIKLFLKYLLTSLHLGRYAHKAAQPVISNLVLKNISVPLPPLSLQQAFAARIIAIESQKDKVKQQITDLQTLFDSRMQYYFD